MGNNRLQMKPDKTDRLWVLAASSSWTMLPLMLDRVLQPETDLVLNLEVCLDQILCQRVKRIFAKLCIVHQLQKYI